MTILVDCPGCKKRTKVPRDAAGKTVRCTGCGARFELPHGSGELGIEWGPARAGVRVPLTPGKKITIGRTKDNTVSLPGALVSRHHATLEWSDSEWKLRDQGSTNGTFVNGQRVIEIGLTDGCRILIGDFALRLAVATGGPSDLDTALDAMAVGESRSGVAAVLDAGEAPGDSADSRVETAWGHVQPAEPEEEAAPDRLGGRALLERWPVVVTLVAIVVGAVVLLITLLS